MCAPFGPAATAAISSCSDQGPVAGLRGFDTDRLPSACGIDLVNHDQPCHVVMQAPGERPPALGQAVAAGAEQVQVRGELHRAGEQFPRQRLRPVQPPLQQHLPPDAAAFVEELPLRERLVRGTRGEPFGDHELRVEEGPQHPVRHQ
jgi:hypothetical protein